MIPLSVALTSLFNVADDAVAVMVFAVANGVYPTWWWLQLPLLVGILAVLGLGIAMLLSALFVRYRDVAPIWEVISQALFYASPILYVTTMVPESYQHAYAANPLAAIFTQMRHAMIDPTAPPVWEAVGGAERLADPGWDRRRGVRARLWVFHREAPRIAENL